MSPSKRASPCGIRTLIVAMGVTMTSAVGWTQTPEADESTQPPKPRVYALLAAIGEKFTFVKEVSRTGTHLLPYVRYTEEIPGDVLNALALHSLDQGVARVDPKGKRVYLTAPAPAVDRVAAPEREAAAMAQIKRALEGMPERAEWDRIVVALPAYRALEINGLAPKLQGFGVFAETQCQAGCGGLNRIDSLRATDPEPPDGVDAVTSEDKPIKARTFVAPFSYIAVWILDPKTLAVLDRQESFDNQKLAERPDKPMDLSDGKGQKYIAMRIANLIDSSIEQAVVNSEVNARRGVVQVGPVREVQPGEEPTK